MEEENMEEKELLKKLDDILKDIKKIYEPIKKRLDKIPKADGEVDSERGKRDRDAGEESIGCQFLSKFQEESLGPRLDIWMGAPMVRTGHHNNHRSALVALSLSGEQHEKYRFEIGEAIDMILGVLTHEAGYECDPRNAVSVAVSLMTIAGDHRRLTLAMQMLGQPKKFKSSARLIAAAVLKQVHTLRCHHNLASALPEAMLNTYCVALEHLEKTMASIKKKKKDKGAPVQHLDEGGALVRKWYPTVVAGCLEVLKWHHRDLADNPLFQKAQQLVVKSVPSIKHDPVLAATFVSKVKEGILGPEAGASLHEDLLAVLEFEITRSNPNSSTVFTCATVEAFGDKLPGLLDTFSSFQLRMGRHLDSQLAKAARSEHGIPYRGAELALCLVMPLGASQEGWTPTLTWRAALKGSSRSSWSAMQDLTKNPTHPVWACDAFYDNEGSPAMSNKEEVMTYMTLRM